MSPPSSLSELSLFSNGALFPAPVAFHPPLAA